MCRVGMWLNLIHLPSGYKTSDSYPERCTRKERIIPGGLCICTLLAISIAALCTQAIPSWGNWSLLISLVNLSSAVWRSEVGLLECFLWKQIEGLALPRRKPYPRVKSRALWVWISIMCVPDTSRFPVTLAPQLCERNLVRDHTLPGCFLIQTTE